MIESSLRDLEMIQKILDGHLFIALGGDEVFRRIQDFGASKVGCLDRSRHDRSSFAQVSSYKTDRDSGVARVPWFAPRWFYLRPLHVGKISTARTDRRCPNPRSRSRLRRHVQLAVGQHQRQAVGADVAHVVGREVVHLVDPVRPGELKPRRCAPHDGECRGPASLAEEAVGDRGHPRARVPRAQRQRRPAAHFDLTAHRRLRLPNRQRCGGRGSVQRIRRRLDRPPVAEAVRGIGAHGVGPVAAREREGCRQALRLHRREVGAGVADDDGGDAVRSRRRGHAVAAGGGGKDEDRVAADIPDVGDARGDEDRAGDAQQDDGPLQLEGADVAPGPLWPVDAALIDAVDRVGSSGVGADDEVGVAEGQAARRECHRLGGAAVVAQAAQAQLARREGELILVGGTETAVGWAAAIFQVVAAVGDRTALEAVGTGRATGGAGGHDAVRDRDCVRRALEGAAEPAAARGAAGGRVAGEGGIGDRRRKAVDQGATVPVAAGASAGAPAAGGRVAGEGGIGNCQRPAVVQRAAATVAAGAGGSNAPAAGGRVAGEGATADRRGRSRPGSEQCATEAVAAVAVAGGVGVGTPAAGGRVAGEGATADRQRPDIRQPTAGAGAAEAGGGDAADAPAAGGRVAGEGATADRRGPAFILQPATTTVAALGGGGGANGAAGEGRPAGGRVAGEGATADRGRPAIVQPAALTAAAGGEAVGVDDQGAIGRVAGEGAVGDRRCPEVRQPAAEAVAAGEEAIEVVDQGASGRVAGEGAVGDRQCAAVVIQDAAAVRAGLAVGDDEVVQRQAAAAVHHEELDGMLAIEGDAGPDVSEAQGRARCHRYRARTARARAHVDVGGAGAVEGDDTLRARGRDVVRIAGGRARLVGRVGRERQAWVHQHQPRAQPERQHGRQAHANLERMPVPRHCRPAQE